MEVTGRQRSAERAEHHVHFSESGEDGDALAPVHKVDVVPAAGKIGIHAGFLKAMHQYRITCRVPVHCHDWLPADIPSLHWRVQQMRPLGDGTELTLQVIVHKEKLLREKLVLSKADDSGQSVTLELNARVLGEQPVGVQAGCANRCGRDNGDLGWVLGPVRVGALTTLSCHQILSSIYSLELAYRLASFAWKIASQSLSIAPQPITQPSIRIRLSVTH
ncbi:UPF0687 protein C20orf27-like [Pollicipes pollicipes]|uniref:UPF0687 protein C20orf27-like n=1 Tax=Pollicipes pollicipes TaxID=41117 RepID=UPI00188537D0|nr:UPF0687 protein C20orf27-like [Pollicipes pollicipes]